MGPCGRLRVVEGPSAGKGFDLEGGTHTVGRDPSSRIHLPEKTVSKTQAVLHCGPDGVFLENRSARNPTLVNEVPAAGRQRLADGDRIVLGSMGLVYEAPPPAHREPPPGFDSGRTVAASDMTPSLLRKAVESLRDEAGEEEEGRCSGCGADLEEGARFCERCGATVVPREAGPAGTRMLRRPWFVVALPGGVTREETLPASGVVLGRSPGCELLVEFPTVSGRHARVEWKGSSYEITDLGSKNGTFVNGKHLTAPHRLRDGDIVRIGDGEGNSVSLTYREAGAEALAALGSVALGRLKTGDKPSFILGRDPTCDVPLEGSAVSWRHARVDRVGDGHAITDLGSTNGTFVSGDALKGRRMLKPGDVIQIGPYRINYTAGGFSSSTSAGRVRVDGVKLRRVVGRGKSTRVILNDVSLSILPREFVAFVGGSGAGKSTLVKSLAGVIRVEGAVLVNGDDLLANYDAWKTMLGYVPQDDVVHGDLTVDRALRYSARLRLPKDTSRAELEHHLDRVLDDVEMTKHRDKLVRSLSGGQRKRVSIGVEMLSEPSLFFLDEPTSGLDPGLEKKMMYMMRRLADGGRTIMMVTHATANVTQCDHVAFLSQGRLVYFGPPAEALAYFGVRDFSDIYSEIEKDPEGLERKFRGSEHHRKYVAGRQRAVSGKAATTTSVTRAHPGHEKKAPGALRQFGILTRRYLELVIRDRLLLTILLAVMPAIGLMLAGMAKPHQLVGKSPATIKDELAADIAAQVATNLAKGEAGKPALAPYAVVKDSEKLLFMTALSIVLLGLFGAAYEVVKERSIYRRERMVNLRIGPYLASKVLVLFGFAWIQCAALLGALMLRVEFPRSGVILPAPLEMYVTLLLAALASIHMGLFLSALAPNANTVIYLVLLVVFAQILLTGTIFPLPEPAKPPSYAMVTRWTLEALGSTVDLPRLDAESQWSLRVQLDINGMKTPVDSAVSKPVGLALGYEHRRDRMVFLWSGLAGFSVAFAVLTSLLLSWRDRREG